MIALDPYVSTRLRMQRLNDAKSFSGWVLGADERSLTVRLRGKGEPQMGDELYAELTSASVKAAAHLCVESLSAAEVRLRVVRGVTVESRHEEPRFYKDCGTCTVHYGGYVFESAVLDTSEQGLGLRSARRLEAGTPVKLVVALAGLRMVLEGCVRYCCQDLDQPSVYRIGVLIRDLSGHERARWLQVATA